MPRTSTVYQVLIASPSDVVTERSTLAEVIAGWNSAHSHARGISLQALRWETDSLPTAGKRPQESLNKQLVENADMLMAVFGVRLGTPTGQAPSGTVEEIERFVETNKPVMLYFSEADVPRDHDPEQLRLLKEYKERRKSDALFATFKDAKDLRDKATQHLVSQCNLLPAEKERSRLPPKLDRVLNHIWHKKCYKSNVVNKVSITETENQELRFETYFSYNVVNWLEGDHIWTANYGCDVRPTEYELKVGGDPVPTERIKRSLAGENLEGFTVLSRDIPLGPNESKKVEFRVQQVFPASRGRESYSLGLPATDMNIKIEHRTPSYEFHAKAEHCYCEGDLVEEKGQEIAVHFRRGVLPYQGLTLHWWKSERV